MREKNTSSMGQRITIENMLIGGTCVWYLMTAFLAGRFLYDSGKELERNKTVQIEKPMENPAREYNDFSYKVMGRIIYDFKKSK